MATLDETLAAFYPSALTALPAADQSVFLPAEMPDPVGAAIQTLQNVGATLPAGAPPPMPPPMPVGPAAPQPPPMPIPGAGPAPMQPDALSGVGPVPAAPAPGPAQPAPQFTPPQAPGTLEQATQAQGAAVADVGQAAMSAEEAKMAAERARAARQATAIEEAADLRTDLMQATQLQRQKNEASADLETATWIQDLQDHAAREPNPGRWWQNQSRLGKALWAIGLLAGAAHKAQTPAAQNVALEMVRQEMAADMEEQRQRLSRQLNALKTSGQVMQERHTRMASDLKDDYAMGLGRIDALERAFLARAVVPGDLDAAAAREQVKLMFAQMKLPYVEQYRREKLDALNRAEDRRFQRGMQASQQAHARRMQEDEQAFTKERDLWQHQYRLAESPVSASVAYSPGGPIPLGKDGLPVLSELQGQGLVLKGPDGKPVGGHGRVRVRPEKLTEASEVVTKANKRYTAMTELLRLLEDNGIGGKEFFVGNLDPAIQKRINELGYEIAKEHDPRVTNQDFSKGVEQAMGFDPNGNWLARGKSWNAGDEVKQMLRDELNAMPKRVNNTFRNFNDAAINGQSEIVWDPQLLAGDKVVEKTAREIRGESPLTVDKAPVVGVKDYETKRAAERDPARRGEELPPHDTGSIHAIIDTSNGMGPATVRAKAADVLDKLRAQEADLTEKLGSAAAVNVERGAPYEAETVKPSTQDPRDMEQLTKVRNTIAIAEAVAKDAEKRAAAKVKDFEGAVKATQHKGFVDEAWIRARAKRAGIVDEAEVRRVIDQFKDYAKSNTGRIERGMPRIGGTR